ncbi:MAG: energy-coupling factor transporter transmembrane component T [Armatimonadota bacterium]|nr:energy-coupling factor transporter transmembrane component T [Armatimonadota bacterium]MDR7452655.1 energy-coupling factor transporter transmembrane component T [Armatimonadota bacterium]MDR7468160.1 energy-coupling factor transporter transmembrane component T [Armatimonadota bacterium]MDR7495154.1 energy-coupling factor transporter transmembrane component T [Armatimonadota bacterium]MDR7499288.1 energy-coupling factor transporter transmembrane component T [Armatimonadota bacterium]
MSRYVTIGQFIPRDSPVHRLDPRTKLAAVTMLMVAIFVARDFAGYTLLTAFLLVVVAVSQLPLGYLLRGLRPVVFLLLLTVLLNLFFSGISGGTPLVAFRGVVVTREAALRALFIAARLVLLIAVTSLLTYTTSPVALTDGIERLLRPFRRMGVPAHELAMMMTIALRFIPTLVEETEKIMKAQMARGAVFDRGGALRRARALVPVLVPLFVSAFRRADELALAMEARCYRGGEHRTRMKELRFAPQDLVALAVTVAASVVVSLPYVAWRHLLR